MAKQHCLIVFLLLPFLVLSATVHPDSLLNQAVSAIENGETTNGVTLFEEVLSLQKNAADNTNYLAAIKRFGKALRDSPEGQREACKVFALANSIPDDEVCSLEEWDLIASINLNASYTADKMLRDIHSALPFYERALYIFDHKLFEESLEVAAYIYGPLAHIYTRLGDYEAAELLLQRALKVFKAAKYDHFIIVTYSDLSVLYESWNKPTLAEENYLEGLEFAQNQDMSRALVLVNYADFLFEQQEFDKAATKIAEVFDILKIEFASSNIDPQATHYYGYCLIKEAQLRQKKTADFAISPLMDEGIDSLTTFFETPYNREIGKAFIAYGNTYLAQQAPEKALQKFQEALHSVLPDYAPEYLNDLPNPTMFYAENTIMEALDGLSLAHEAIFKKSKDKHRLDLALQCQNLIDDIEKRLRRSYLYESAKLFNLEENREHNSRAIDLCLQLFALTSNQSYQWKAFEYAERNRSTLLREAFNHSSAVDFAGLTQMQIQTEAELKLAVNQAEEALFELKSETAIDSLVQQAEIDLRTANENLSRWIQDLEIENPQYFQAKYQEQTLTVAGIQQWLQKEEVLIEYFLGKEQITTFVINRNGLHVFQQNHTETLSQKVLFFRKSIENYQLENSDKAALTAHYQQVGHELYQELVAPLQATLEGASKLVIIPSGVLDILPFETLLTNEIKGFSNFNELPYLIKSYAIRYGYSADLLQTLHEKPRVAEGWIGFSPDFEKDSNWSALPCSKKMIAAFSGIKNHVPFFSKDANIEQFETSAPTAGMIHLATHAQANAENGDFSFIVFSDGQGGLDSLYTKDLYLLELNAELVLLSACETALGTLYESEGVISLARGFHYAGARSVITTLWQVNERTSCALMEQLYANLNKGQAKDEALHQAKLNYLENAEIRAAHPVYWAGFQVMGNPRPLYPKNHTLWYLLSAIFIGGLLVVRKRFVKN